MLVSKTLAVGLAGVLALGVGGVALARGGSDYTVSVRLASATNVVRGGPVLVDGFTSGKVTDIEVDDGAAVVTMTLDKDVVPLHAGAQVVVGWKATLSERQIEVTDGSEENAAIPDGGQIPGTMPQPMEIDQVLDALDPPTRKRLQSLTGRLADTFEGHEQDLRATLTTGGPAVQELGQLLKAVGTDGPAIKNLVRRLNAMMTTLAQRDDQVSRIVDGMASATRTVAARRESLRSSLQELPGTLGQARTTLDLVPSVVDEAVPLLDALEPATAKLGPVAQQLSPVLRDLRPLATDLRPAVSSFNALLDLTPGLLDTVHGTTPGLDQAAGSAQQPVSFLRPYTPEIMAFFSTWASAFANYDSNGNFARIHGQEGPTSVNENPGVLPPGVTSDPYPAPGEVVGQAWTDANGDEMR